MNKDLRIVTEHIHLYVATYYMCSNIHMFLHSVLLICMDVRKLSLHGISPLLYLVTMQTFVFNRDSYGTLQ